MNKSIRLATVFSGVGAIEHALHRMDIPFHSVFACDNGERTINLSVCDIESIRKVLSPIQLQEFAKKEYAKTKKPNYMKEVYFANYQIDESQWHEDIRFIDGSSYQNKVDLFVGGSPCQSFSIIGKRAGLNDTRGTLFYDYARLVNEIKPKVFIFENVMGMLSHDKGNTWKVIHDVFVSLNYKTTLYQLNSIDFGVPQNRKRIYVVGFKDQSINMQPPTPIELTTTLLDFLENKPIEAKFYLGRKGFEFVTNPKYRNRAKINPNIIQTQKANQQFNWNGDFVFEQIEKIKTRQDIIDRAFIGSWNNLHGVIRQLTPRECFNLMGFDGSFKIIENRIHAYRQAGNSIVVDVLIALLSQILKVCDLYE